MLPFDVAEHSHTHDGPSRYVLDLVAYHGYIPKQHKGGEKHAGKQGPPKQYLYALRHETFYQVFHHLWEVDLRGAHPHAVDITRTARKAIAHIVFHASAMECGTHQSAHKHVQHVEHRKCLEEVLERHDFVQTPHKRNAQHSITESSPHKRHTQLRDADVRIHEEVKSSCIEAKRKQRKRYQFIHIPAEIRRVAAA